jgi:hypothetical protein
MLVYNARVNQPPVGYRATPKLARELAREGQASLEGGRYRATVACSGSNYFEAWTDSIPFVYGRPSTTLQGALDSLEEAVRQADEARRAS